ncbi:MAG TPA: hypothetical protein VMW27_19075 [Thermoanaerobaculia bacterium]|nr:hypothetical protein [Thermoanaerobaculia bacterium]
MEMRTLLGWIGVTLLVALILACVVLALTWRKLRRIRLPPNADFFTTVRAVPLSLVVGLDLLDLGLDFLSTPVIWFLLDRAGLPALRNVASFEALIPLTGPIPTLTLAWFAARMLNLGRPFDPNVIETERVGPNRYVPRNP